MGNNLIIALHITFVGMGLIFLAITLLWGLLEVLANITSDNKKTPGILPSPDINHKQLRAKVAGAAVMVALMLEDETVPHEFPLPPTALVSAWQAVMRTDILRKQGRNR